MKSIFSREICMAFDKTLNIAGFWFSFLNEEETWRYFQGWNYLIYIFQPLSTNA